MLLIVILRDLCTDSKKPVIFTLTQNFSTTVNNLDNKFGILHMEKLAPEEIKGRLIDICEKEAIDDESINLDELIENTNCDMRRAINQLQLLAAGLDHTKPVRLKIDVASVRPKPKKKRKKGTIDSDDDEPSDKLENEKIEKQRFKTRLQYELDVLADRMQTRYCVLESHEVRRRFMHSDPILPEAEQFLSHELELATEMFNSMRQSIQKCFINLEKDDFLHRVRPYARHFKVDTMSNHRRRELVCDYLPYLNTIAANEEKRNEGAGMFDSRRARTRRFFHYFDKIKLYDLDDQDRKVIGTLYDDLKLKQS